MGKYTGAGGGTSDAASASASGIIELATDAEVQTGTDSTRAVTPASMRACTATEIRIGVVERATDAEVQTGSDTSRYISPASLAACTATATRSGVVELATDNEAIGGSDTSRAITGANLKAKINELVVVGNETTNLLDAQTGAIVYLSHANSAIVLPNACAVGTNFTIINNTGASETVGLSTNGALVSGMPNNVIVDHMSKSFICVTLAGSVSTWAVIG